MSCLLLVPLETVLDGMLHDSEFNALDAETCRQLIYSILSTEQVAKLASAFQLVIFALDSTTIGLTPRWNRLLVAGESQPPRVLVFQAKCHRRFNRYASPSATAAANSFISGWRARAKPTTNTLPI